MKSSKPELTNYTIDLLGNKLYDEVSYSVRKFQCRVCKGSFKQSQGVLFISGFYCDNHNPKRFS